MITSRLLLVAAIFTAPFAQGSANAAERIFKREFVLPAEGVLVVDTYRGGIVVEESKDDVLRAEVRVELATTDENEADRTVEALKLSMETVDGGVRVRARNPEESRVLFDWERRIELSLRFQVPRGARLDLATLDGSVTVGNFRGQVDARARAGTIFCRRIDGSIKARVETGEIVVSRCSGTLEAWIRIGDIRAGTLFGAADLRSHRGDIEVMSALGGIVARTAAGDVRAGFQKGFRGAAKIEADGGDVVLQIDPTAPMSVRASATWGRVATTLPFAVSAGGPGKHTFSGELNGGGPEVRLHAAGGRVQLLSYQLFLDLKDEN